MNTPSLIAAGALLLAALGCRDDTPAPTEPAPAAPQAAGAAAAPLSFWQMSAGRFHTCAVTTDSVAYCWGYDASGQLGDGFEVGSIDVPFAVKGGLFFRQVDAGGYHTCGVTPQFRVYCWGEILGNGTPTTNRSAIPVVLPGNRSFRQVSTGFRHSCGVTTPGQAFCWGENGQGQLGDGTTTTRLTPVAVAGGLSFKAVSAGVNHTCAVTTANRAYCWGSNLYGQLGDSSAASRRLRPVRVRTTRQFRQIDAGENHTCAVTTEDRAFCWGRNGSGQLGDGTLTQRRWPRAVAGGFFFTRVTTGARHTCAETRGNRAYCWGHNAGGRLGDGTTLQRRNPVAVVGGLQFQQVSAGWEHTCGKSDTDVGYCWGSNGVFGSLGNGSSAEAHTPTPVAPPFSF